MASYTPQPLVMDGDVVRFRQNKIVRFLLYAGPFDMNQLSLMSFDREDFEQFAQLIGYSVSGFSDLDYATDDVVAIVDEQAAKMANDTLQNNSGENTG